MLKGLAGVTTHEHRNGSRFSRIRRTFPPWPTQCAAASTTPSDPLRHGYLDPQAWAVHLGPRSGRSPAACRDFEFLFEVLGRRLSLPAHCLTAVLLPSNLRIAINIRRYSFVGGTVMAQSRIQDEGPRSLRPQKSAISRPVRHLVRKWEIDGRMDAEAARGNSGGLRSRDRTAQAGWRFRDGRRDQRRSEHAEPGRDARPSSAKEHTHSEDEVRFTVKGGGVFHIHPQSGPVFAIAGRSRRSDQRAERHAALVRPVQATARSAASACSKTPPAGRRITSTAAKCTPRINPSAGAKLPGRHGPAPSAVEL